MARNIRAPRGPSLSCKGWQQEAAMRMLMNNLEVGEKPEELIIYGGTGKAARNWECFDAIVSALKELGDEETLLVQSGKPVAVFPTHRLLDLAPRVLISNAMLVPKRRRGKTSGSWKAKASPCCCRSRCLSVKRPNCVALTERLRWLAA